MLQCSLQEFCPGSRLLPELPNWPASKLVHWPTALERAGGKCGLMKEMLQMLLASVPATREALQHALNNHDSAQLLQQVHKLPGACCYTGVPRLKDLAELLATQLKQGKSLAGLEPEFLVLDDVLQALWQESQHWPDW